MASTVLFAGVGTTDYDSALPWYERLLGRPPDLIPHATDATRITGGSKVERAELRRILQTLGATGIGTLAVEPATHPWTSRSKDAVVLRYTPRAKDRESWWEGELIAQSFAVRSARAGLPPVIAVLSDIEGSHIHIGRRAKPPRWSPLAVKQAIITTARRQDATVSVLRVAALNGRPVIRLRVRVDDPARFLVQRLSLVLAALPDFDAGRFVEVTDSAGNLALLSAGAGNWGMGGSGKAFESCYPSALSYPVGYEPRPCPFSGPPAYALPGAQPTQSISHVAATAAAEAHEGESVTMLNIAPTAAELCRSYRIAHCPRVAGTTWVATLTKGSGRDRVDRWLMITDAGGRAVANGPLQ